MAKTSNGSRNRVLLFLYDALLLILTDVGLLVLYPSNITRLEPWNIALQFALTLVIVLGSRVLLKVYDQVWRYADTKAYLRMILADFIALVLYFAVQTLLPFKRLSFMRTIGLVAANLMLTMAVRLVYQYLYQASSKDSKTGTILRNIVHVMTGMIIEPTRVTLGDTEAGRKINIAIVGAGRVGVNLAEELKANPKSSYRPCCFVDIDREKIGRYIDGIRVLSEEEANAETFAQYPIQEIVFALPRMEEGQKRDLYLKYKDTGCRIKVYDVPVTQNPDSGKKQLREFSVEDLLFRAPKEFLNEETKNYYKNKVVLISGGGGSIGSELCRQIARMEPKQLIVLDIYENNAYDIQQELKIRYGQKLDFHAEILSVTDRDELEKVFAEYRPQIVLHAAAHKHVPLMEKNCCEAIRNNVFGTVNMADMAEKYGTEHFIMISTDKAVNPTNVMGATKRMCEMVILSRNGGNTSFTATRFGNVLGSNGSVIPLFKRQIAEGGPVTLTDKRIIRYFMTIPEASQLVLTSGAMAKAGELFVLDMGEPVKILELAEEMIRLSGYEPYKEIEIRETGLRPGEKLYEELLIKGENLSKTDNEKIFVETDVPLTKEQVKEKLMILEKAIESEDDDAAREALRSVVPTFKRPEEVNGKTVSA